MPRRFDQPTGQNLVFFETLTGSADGLFQGVPAGLNWNNPSNWYVITGWPQGFNNDVPTGTPALRIPDQLDQVWIYGRVQYNTGSLVTVAEMTVRSPPERAFNDFEIDITVTGRTEFYQFNYNSGTITTTQADFFDESGNIGTIVGNANFYNASGNYGVVTGNVGCFTSRPSAGGGCGNG
jgi:hypothetical protein